MSVEVAKLLKPEIEALLRAGNREELHSSLVDFHGADIEAILTEFEPPQQAEIFEALERALQIEVFGYCSLEMQEHLLEALSPTIRKAVLNGITPDDRAELFDQLPEELRNKLLAELTIDERAATLDLLNREESSAGRIMTPEFLAISARDTVETAFEKIRKEAEHVETVYVVYVTDNEGRLIGTLSLRDLLRAKPADLVKHLMTTEPVICHPDAHQEEIAALMKKYDLVAIPVVGVDGRMQGIVTFDDIHDVVDEQASEDILRMHGIAAESDSYFDASIGQKLRQRMVVLASLACVSFLSVLVQGAYNHIIASTSILAIYLSLLMGSSGNCGTQVAGIIIRAQSIQIKTERLKRVVLREIVVGVAMALLMALVAVALVFVFGARNDEALGGHSLIWVGAVVGFAMFAAISTINMLGGIIPLVLNRVGIDPAIAAGPFITTMADILTVLIYFNIASLMLNVG